MTTTFRDLVALTIYPTKPLWLIFIEFINGQFVGDVVGSGYILLLLLHAPDIHEEKQSISNLFHSATRYYYPREYWQVGRMLYIGGIFINLCNFIDVVVVFVVVFVIV